VTKIIRFGVSLDETLLNKFDKINKKKGYANRSEAIRDLLREELVKQEWTESNDVAGTITLVYNHHTRGLSNKLIEIQHNYTDVIISSQHIHIDHDNCLEIIILKGSPKKMEKISSRLKSTKGIKHCSLTMATTGKNLD